MEKNKKEKIEYISLFEAAKISGYAQDYLSLLCRQGKLNGEKIGRNWVTTYQWLDEYQRNLISDMTLKKNSVASKKDFKEIEGKIRIPRPHRCASLVKRCGRAELVLATSLFFLILLGGFGYAKNPQFFSDIQDIREKAAIRIVAFSSDLAENVYQTENQIIYRMSDMGKNISQALPQTPSSEDFRHSVSVVTCRLQSTKEKATMRIAAFKSFVNNITSSAGATKIHLANQLSKTGKKVLNNTSRNIYSRVDAGKSIAMIPLQVGEKFGEGVITYPIKVPMKIGDSFEKGFAKSDLVLNSSFRKFENYSSSMVRQAHHDISLAVEVKLLQTLRQTPKFNFGNFGLAIQDGVNNLSKGASVFFRTADRETDKEKEFGRVAGVSDSVEGSLQQGPLRTTFNSISKIGKFIWETPIKIADESAKIVVVGPIKIGEAVIAAADKTINQSANQISKAADQITGAYIFAGRSLANGVNNFSDKAIRFSNKVAGLFNSGLNNLSKKLANLFGNSYFGLTQLFVEQPGEKISQVPFFSGGGKESEDTYPCFQSETDGSGEIENLKEGFDILKQEIDELKKAPAGKIIQQNITQEIIKEIIKEQKGEQGLAGPQGLTGAVGPQGPVGTGTTIVQGGDAYLSGGNTWIGGNVFEGHTLMNSLGVSHNTSVGDDFFVGGTTTLGTKATDNLNVHATSNFYSSLNVTNDITQSGGQVTFGGNVDAASGLDITGADLTVSGTNFVVDVATGNISTAGDLTIAGTTTLGDASADTIIPNAQFAGDLIPSQTSVYNLGSATNYWDSAYINNIVVGSTNVGGTTSESFILNTDNATADAEDIWMEFERGTAAPNAKILWSSGNTRFDFNFPIYFSGTGEISGPGAGGLTLTNDSGPLTVSTTSSGNLALSSADDLTLSSGGATLLDSTGALTLDSGTGVLTLGAGTNTIINTDADTAILINPNGTGAVQFHSTSNYIDSSGNLILDGNITLTSGGTFYTTANNDLVFAPNGSGNLVIGETANPTKIIPFADSTVGYDLGEATQRWYDLYLKNSIDIDSTKLDINSLDFVGLGQITTGASTDLTLQSGAGGKTRITDGTDYVDIADGARAFYAVNGSQAVELADGTWAIDAVGDINLSGDITIAGGKAIFGAGAETIDNETSNLLKLTTSGDTKVVLGDDAGAKQFQIADSGGNVVAYVDSDGNVSAVTGAFSTYVQTPQIQTGSGDLTLAPAGKITTTQNFETTGTGTITSAGLLAAQDGLTVSGTGNILFSTSGTIEQSGSGQVTFAGNVDANSGLDITGITNLGDGGTANYARFSSTGDLTFFDNNDGALITGPGATGMALTNAGGDLTVSTTSSGDLILNSDGDTIISTAAFDLNNTGPITLGTAGSEQHITFKTQNFDVDSTGTITIDGTNFTYNPSGTYAVTPGSTYTIDSTGAVSIDSDASSTLSGAGVNITSDGANAMTFTYADGGTFELKDNLTRISFDNIGAAVFGNDDATTTIDGSTITLSGNTIVSGTIQENLTDNTTDAYDLQEGNNNYININTTDGLEEIQFGNTTTNPDYAFLGSGDFAVSTGSITLTSGAGDLVLGAGTNTIINTDADTAILINPNGTGAVQFHSTSNYIDSSGNLILDGNITLTSGGTFYTTANNDLVFAPNGSGNLVIGETANPTKIIPFADSTVGYDLGEATQRWYDLYLKNSIDIDSTKLDINSLDFVGLGQITTGASTDLTLQSGAGGKTRITDGTDYVDIADGARAFYAVNGSQAVELADGTWAIDAVGDINLSGDITIAGGKAIFGAGAETIDNETSNLLKLTTSGDTKVVLGDDAGAKQFQIADSGGNVVAYVDSDGNVSAVTGAFSTYVQTPQIQTGSGDLTLAPAGKITTTQNFETTGTGTITSAGLLAAQDGLTVSGTGNILFSTSGTIEQSGSGQVTFAGNVDANSGLDVAGQCVTGDTLLPIISDSGSLTLETLEVKLPEQLLEQKNADATEGSLPQSTVEGYLPNIQYIQIKDVQPGMKVLSLNEETNKIEPHRINGLLDMGVKPIYEIVTEDGRTIRTTGNHPYLKKSGSLTSGASENQKVKKQALGVGDFRHPAPVSGFGQNQKALNEQDSLTRRPVELNHIPKGTDQVSTDSQNRPASASSRPRNNILTNKENKNNLFVSEEVVSVPFFRDVVSIDTRYYHYNKPENFVKGLKVDNFSGSLTSGASKVLPLFKGGLRGISNWIKVSHLNIGDEIAVADIAENADAVESSLQQRTVEGYLQFGSTKFVKIKEINLLPSEQVYDIEVEGTHNFVAGHFIENADAVESSLQQSSLQQSIENADAVQFGQFGGIIAHNTYIETTTSPQLKLAYDTSNYLTVGVDSSGSTILNAVSSDPDAGVILSQDAIYQPQSSYQADQGLVGYWSFNEGQDYPTSTTAYDISTSENDGTLVNFDSAATSIGNAGGTTLIDTGLSGTDDTYNTLELYITSGTNSGEHQTISDYDGGTTTITVDTAFTGQIASGVTYIVGRADGKYGKGLQFDGKDDYVDTNSTFQSTFRDSFSISAWIKPTDGQPVIVEAILGSENTALEDRMFLSILSAGKLRFGYESNNNGISADTTSAVFSDGQEDWHHVVGVADSTIGGVGGLKLYLNGIEQTLDGVYDGDTSGITFADWTSVDELFIGARDDNGSSEMWFDGLIDEVKIYDRAISADEIKAHYLRGSETYTDFAISTSATAGEQYANRIVLTDTGVVTTGTDTSYGQKTDVTRTGATGGTIDTYGIHSTVLADNAGSGTSTATAGYFKATGADTNYGILVDAGDTILDEDLVVGGSTSRTATLLNAGFSLGGDDLFVAGMAGVEGSIYTDAGLVVGNSTTYANKAIYTGAAEELSIKIGGASGTELIGWDASGNLTLGDSGSTTAIDSSSWAIDSGGIMTGISGITTDGGYTQSGAGQNTFTGNINATSGLDISGAALTIDNQAITQTTGGQVTFAGNVDANSGLDVAGQCVTGDSELITENNEKLRVDQVKGGEIIYSLNQKTGKLVPARINALMDMGVKPVFEITTVSGKKIETTGNHPYLKKSGSLTSGASEVKLPEQSISNIFPGVDLNNSDDASGIVNIKNNSDVNANSEAVGGRIAADFSDIAMLERMRERTHFFDFADDSISGDFVKSPEIFTGFVGEFVDEHNYEIKNSSSISSALTQPLLASQSAIIDSIRLRASGVSNSLSHSLNSFSNFKPATKSLSAFEKSSVLGSKTPTTDLSLMNNGFDNVFINLDNLNNSFNNYNKNKNRLSNTNWTKVKYLQPGQEIAVANQGTTEMEWDEIISIEYTGEKQVWDIEVEGTHNFVANGIIAHNTYMAGLADAVQLTVRANATQTSDLVVFEQSDGTDVFTVDNAGNVDIAGTIDNGLVAWWPLDEGTGVNALDKSGQSHDGTLFFSCGTSTVTDIDSNVYNTVAVGTQCWMARNMEVTHYPGGGAITKGPSGHGAAGWDDITTAYYSCPPETNNTEEDCEASVTLGMFYQWKAAMNSAGTCNGTGESQPECTNPVQGICPDGWHMPSHYEWTKLERQICGDNLESNCLAEFLYDTSDTGWKGNSEGSDMAGNVADQNWSTDTLTNDSHFDDTGLDIAASGHRSTTGYYTNRSLNTYLWSSTESGDNAWRRYLTYTYADVDRYKHSKAYGFSVRCVKD